MLVCSQEREGRPGELEERGEVWGLGTRSDGFPLPRPDTDLRPDTGSAQVRRDVLTHLSVLFQMANGHLAKGVCGNN